MVVDDIVVVGAKPLFMTDYIACGKVVPDRIADIVAGIARACAETGTALVGGETAEHPGLLGPDDYDVAGAAVGAVEADAVLGADRVRDGDVVLALASSGLHSNGFSLVRHILASAASASPTTPTSSAAWWARRCSSPPGSTRRRCSTLLGDASLGRAIHSPQPRDRRRHRGQPRARAAASARGSRSTARTWSPPPVFRVLSDLAGTTLESRRGHLEPRHRHVRGRRPRAADAAVIAAHRAPTASPRGVSAPSASATRDLAGFEQGAKGVDGGAVRLVGSYAS